MTSNCYGSSFQIYIFNFIYRDHIGAMDLKESFSQFIRNV